MQMNLQEALLTRAVSSLKGIVHESESREMTNPVDEAEITSGVWKLKIISCLLIVKARGRSKQGEAELLDQ